MSNTDQHVSWNAVCGAFKLDQNVDLPPEAVAYYTNKYLLWRDEIEGRKNDADRKAD